MPVTIRECPHCYRRVGFNEDGVCPSCSKNLTDPGADASRTVFTIFEARPPSPICFVCGCPTTHRISVSRENRSSGWRIFRIVGSILVYCMSLIFHGLLRVLDNRDKHPYRKVRVSVPVCAACQRAHGAPSAHQVDFENGSMSFVVPRDVAAKL